jgi:flagellar protein FliO/FliZ
VQTHRALTAALAAAPLCVLLAPATVLAAAGKDPYGEQTPLNLPADGGAAHASSVGSGSGSLARTFVGLAVVVAVIYGLTWVLRQMKASKEERSHGVGLSTEASMPLGPGRSVHLIRAGRELVLVGSAEQGIVPIRTYTEDEARDLGLLAGDLASEADGFAAETGVGGDRVKVKVAFSEVLERLRERTAR